MSEIEAAVALHGEAVALLHHYRGGDLGWKNCLADDVRKRAKAVALAVVDAACGAGPETCARFGLAADHGWVQHERHQEVRQRIEAVFNGGAALQEGEENPT